MVGTVEKEILDIQDDSVIKIRQKLFPEEEKMNLAKYFYKYPLHYPSPIEMQIINTMNHNIAVTSVISPTSRLQELLREARRAGVSLDEALALVQSVYGEDRT